MVCSQHDNTAGDHLCSLSFSTGAFAMDWHHCDQISNYVSRVVASNKEDSFVFSNLFSTVINEVLEAVFRSNSGRDNITIDIYQSGNDSVIISSIPVDDTARAFYEKVILNLEKGNAKDLYRDLIKSDKGFVPETGFYELAADYDAAITMENKPGDHRVILSVRVCLESSAEEDTK